MNHKAGKIFFTSIMIVMVAVILVFLGSKIVKNPIRKDNVLTKQVKKMKDSKGNSEEISEKIIPTHPEVGVLPYEGNIVDLGDVFSVSGIQSGYCD